jgi:hypothetical protein
MNGPRIREADLQRAIIDYLDLRHIFHYRQNPSATKIDNRFSRFARREPRTSSA